MENANRMEEKLKLFEARMSVLDRRVGSFIQATKDLAHSNRLAMEIIARALEEESDEKAKSKSKKSKVASKKKGRNLKKSSSTKSK